MKNKVIIPSIIGLSILGICLGTDTDEQNNLNSINSSIVEENYKNANKENNFNKGNEINNSETTKKENNKNIIDNSTQDNNVKNNDNNQILFQENDNTSKTETKSSEQLPLKAICNDGTISYQDDASKPNYRGMCSSHKGIKKKLGRIK